MKSVLFLILFISFSVLNAQEKIKVIYIGDPMCSWCYGFAPEISKIKEHFKDVEFNIVLGGLRPDGKEKIQAMDMFLRHHWGEINRLTGQPFSYDILKQKDFIYNTEPACRAVVVARELKPGIELEFFKAIQKSFYEDNENTNDVNTYIKIARKCELDSKKFKSLFLSEEMKLKTKEDFEYARKLGINSFPAVVVSKDGNVYLASRGYSKSEKVIETINRILK